jgi:hypothetical protein
MKIHSIEKVVIFTLLIIFSAGILTINIDMYASDDLLPQPVLDLSSAFRVLKTIMDVFIFSLFLNVCVYFMR